jgi:hypothetical protein
MSAYASCNNQQIVSASICIPLYGIWAGDITLPLTTTIPTTPGALSLVFGNLTLIGSAFRMASFAGSRTIRVVGGYAGWRTQVMSKAYMNSGGVSLNMVLSDVAFEVGESISLAQQTTIGPFYIREAAQAQRVLRQLGGPLWWMDMTGVTQVGPRTSTAIQTPFTVVNWSGSKGLFDIATEDNQSWLPGNTFSSDTVSTPQTISMTTLVVDNDGVLRMRVLSTGEQDLS